jgi:hypothetical protein
MATPLPRAEYGDEFAPLRAGHVKNRHKDDVTELPMRLS